MADWRDYFPRRRTGGLGEDERPTPRGGDVTPAMQYQGELVESGRRWTRGGQQDMLTAQLQRQQDTQRFNADMQNKRAADMYLLEAGRRGTPLNSQQVDQVYRHFGVKRTAAERTGDWASATQERLSRIARVNEQSRANNAAYDASRAAAAKSGEAQPYFEVQATAGSPLVQAGNEVSAGELGASLGATPGMRRIQPGQEGMDANVVAMANYRKQQEQQRRYNSEVAYQQSTGSIPKGIAGVDYETRNMRGETINTPNMPNPGGAPPPELVDLSPAVRQARIALANAQPGSPEAKQAMKVLAAVQKADAVSAHEALPPPRVREDAPLPSLEDAVAANRAKARALSPEDIARYGRTPDEAAQAMGAEATSQARAQKYRSPAGMPAVDVEAGPPSALVTPRFRASTNPGQIMLPNPQLGTVGQGGLVTGDASGQAMPFIPGTVGQGGLATGDAWTTPYPQTGPFGANNAPIRAIPDILLPPGRPGETQGQAQMRASAYDAEMARRADYRRGFENGPKAIPAGYDPYAGEQAPIPNATAGGPMLPIQWGGPAAAIAAMVPGEAGAQGPQGSAGTPAQAPVDYGIPGTMPTPQQARNRANRDLAAAQATLDELSKRGVRPWQAPGESGGATGGGLPAMGESAADRNLRLRGDLTQTMLNERQQQGPNPTPAQQAVIQSQVAGLRLPKTSAATSLESWEGQANQADADIDQILSSPNQQGRATAIAALKTRVDAELRPIVDAFRAGGLEMLWAYMKEMPGVRSIQALTPDGQAAIQRTVAKYAQIVDKVNRAAAGALPQGSPVVGQPAAGQQGGAAPQAAGQFPGR